MALAAKNDPEIQMKYLFTLYDSNRNGFLNKAEVVDIFKIFMLLYEREKNVGSAQLESELEKFNNFVNKAFGDKTQVSLDEFRQICAENEELKKIADKLHPLVLVAL